MKRTVLCMFLAFGFMAPMMSVKANENTRIDEFSAQRRVRPVSTRIEVYPSSRQVRRCVDWYAIEHRPSGDVLTPHMRCWWARQ
jgi:hypothetical protein